MKKQEVELEMFIAEATQANYVGGMILSEYIFEKEEMDMNAILEAVDWFKKAALLSRGAILFNIHTLVLIHKVIPLTD